MREIKERGFLKLVGIVFGFVSAMHLIRAVLGWNLAIGFFNVPPLWSYYAAFMAFMLSAIAFSLTEDNSLVKAKKKKNGRKKSR